MITFIEPTPSPNTMKINLSERLPDGVRETYLKHQSATAPEPVNRLLAIEGVTGLYRAADFIAIDRSSRGDWQHILAAVRDILGDGAGEGSPDGARADAPVDAAAFGEVQVRLQHFRGIPLQVRVTNGHEEKRAALPPRFSEAAIRGAAAAPNLIKERSLDDWDVRYGELQEVLDSIVQELDASYTDEQLEGLIAQAVSGPVEAEARTLADSQRRVLPLEEAKRELLAEDWKRRYAALQQLKPSAETMPLLVQALQDEQTAIRRLAAVYLGDVKDAEPLPHLLRALKDRSAAVRRTAGDTLSDRGDPAAQPAMIEALRDSNKLVRWRAARFLYEAGDEQALAALREAAEDPEFEVRMQARIALERIEGGQAAEGSVWQQMTRRER